MDMRAGRVEGEMYVGRGIGLERSHHARAGFSTKLDVPGASWLVCAYDWRGDRRCRRARKIEGQYFEYLLQYEQMLWKIMLIRR